METNLVDWSRFVVRIAIHADVEELYRLWATRSGMESWFLRESVYGDELGQERGPHEFVKPGDTYTWRWHGWPDDVTEHGEILECNGRDRFVFSFGKAGVCHVSITEQSGHHLVELLQTDIPTDDNGRFTWYVGCKTGWTFYLTNMKSLAEGGIDLRNRDLALKDVVNS